MKTAKKFFQIILTIIVLCSVSYICYQQDWFDIHNKAVQTIRTQKVKIDSHKKIRLNERNQVRQRLMRETQTGL